MNNKAKELANLQRLCSTGLDGVSLMPEIIKTLHKIIPTSHNALFWLDKNNNPVGGYHEIDSHAPYAQHYITSFANGVEYEAIPTLKSIVKNPDRVFVSTGQENRVYDSKLYDEVWRPINCHYVAEVGVGNGVLMLIREKSDRNFSVTEVSQIQSVAQNLRVAFNDIKKSPTYIANEEPELILVNDSSKIELLSPNASYLLKLANSQNYVTNKSAEYNWQINTEIIFRNLVERLKKIAVDRISPPAHYVHHNPWGKFEFCGILLKDSEFAGSHRKYAILLKHAMPSSFYYLHKIQKLNLSDREKTVALLIVNENSSQNEIANRLRISAHTVITHIRHIYSKLGISSREELKTYLSNPLAN